MGCTLPGLPLRRRPRARRRARRIQPVFGTAKERHSWRFTAAAPPREVFAVMEQLIGTPPYRFQVVGDDEARALEVQRRGFFGNWGRPRIAVRWISCRAGPATARKDSSRATRSWPPRTSPPARLRRTLLASSEPAGAQSRGDRVAHASWREMTAQRAVVRLSGVV